MPLTSGWACSLPATSPTQHLMPGHQSASEHKHVFAECPRLIAGKDGLAYVGWHYV